MAVSFAASYLAARDWESLVSLGKAVKLYWVFQAYFKIIRGVVLRQSLSRNEEEFLELTILSC